MKKFLAVMLCVFCAMALFAGTLEVDLGIIGQYNSTLGDTLEESNNFQEFKFDINDFNFGATADVKFTIADVNATAFVTKVEDKAILNGLLSGNVVLDIFFVRVGVGLGVNYLYDAENGFRFVGGDFLNANLSVRAEVDVLLGNLRVGLYGYVPTLYTLSNITTFKYDEVDIQNFWKAAVVGVSLKASLF